MRFQMDEAGVRSLYATSRERALLIKARAKMAFALQCLGADDVDASVALGLIDMVIAETSPPSSTDDVPPPDDGDDEDS